MYYGPGVEHTSTSIFWCYRLCTEKAFECVRLGIHSEEPCGLTGPDKLLRQFSHSSLDRTSEFALEPASKYVQLLIIWA